MPTSSLISDNMCVDTDMCADMFVDMCAGMGVGMRADMRVDMRVDLCVWQHPLTAGHAHGQTHR